MKLTCPACGAEYPIEAGLLEDDGKRLAAILAETEPALARAALAYLRLFKPATTALRTVRAIRLLTDLLGLVRAGTVSRDERSGIQRPATAAQWIAGIELMLQQIGSLALPLGSHVYLRKVVFGLADAADAAAERHRDQELKKGRRPSGPSDGSAGPRSLETELEVLRNRRELGRLSQADYDRLVGATRAHHAKVDGGASDT